MIDFSHEELVHLREVPALLPSHAGKRIHISTVYRWVNRGVDGVRLETVKVGGLHYTSHEALSAFFVQNPNYRPPYGRSPPSAEADPDELTRDGIV